MKINEINEINEIRNQWEINVPGTSAEARIYQELAWI